MPALLDGLVGPVRSGVILTRQGLAAAARTIGVGYRLGERRFALNAMLEQDPGATMTWMVGEARRWAELHGHSGADTTSRWWAARAARTATVLTDLLTRPAPPGDLA